MPYALPTADVSPALPPLPAGAPVRIRVLLHCIYADFPGLAGLSKFKLGGYWASRRCKKQGVKLHRRVVYQGAREDARTGCQPSSHAAVLDAGSRHLEAGRADGAERKRIGEETGWTGFPMLSLLCPVFGFDLVRDVVGDAAHKYPLNQTKNFMSDTLEQKFRKVAGQKVPCEAPLANAAVLAENLRRMKPTRELGNGRVPKDPSKKSLKYWKAEELQKAALFYFPLIFEGAIDEEGYALAELIHFINRVIFIHGRLEGWTPSLRDVFAQLSKAKYVRGEEQLGPKGRPLEHENGQHSCDDVVTHGSPDALWCYEMEREVKRLVATPHNGKQYETTLALRREGTVGLEFLSDRQEEAELAAAGKLDGDALWETARSSFESRLLIVGNQEKAAEMTSRLASVRRSAVLPVDGEILASAGEKGVGVGSAPASWRRRSHKPLSLVEAEGVKRLLLRERRVDAAARTCVPLKSVQLAEKNFSKKDYVAVRRRVPSLEDAGWDFGRVERIYAVDDVEGERHVFVNVAFFKVAVRNGRPVGGPVHNLLQLGELRGLGPDRVRFASDLARHFIPVPEQAGQLASQSQVNFVMEVLPPELPFAAADVWVPFVPQVCEGLHDHVADSLLGC